MLCVNAYASRFQYLICLLFSLSLSLTVFVLLFSLPDSVYYFFLCRKLPAEMCLLPFVIWYLFDSKDPTHTHTLKMKCDGSKYSKLLLLSYLVKVLSILNEEPKTFAFIFIANILCDDSDKEKLDIEKALPQFFICIIIVVAFFSFIFIFLWILGFSSTVPIHLSIYSSNNTYIFTC